MIRAHYTLTIEGPDRRDHSTAIARALLAAGIQDYAVRRVAVEEVGPDAAERRRVAADLAADQADEPEAETREHDGAGRWPRT